MGQGRIVSRPSSLRYQDPLDVVGEACAAASSNYSYRPNWAEQIVFLNNGVLSPRTIITRLISCLLTN